MLAAIILGETSAQPKNSDAGLQQAKAGSQGLGKATARAKHQRGLAIVNFSPIDPNEPLGKMLPPGIGLYAAPIASTDEVSAHPH
jgi:hypothetical protein